jgi:hypothetical protein
MPPTAASTASTLAAGPPPLPTWIVALSWTGSWARSGGVAENDGTTVLRSMNVRMRLRMTQVAPARPAAAPAPMRSLRRDMPPLASDMGRHYSSLAIDASAAAA